MTVRMVRVLACAAALLLASSGLAAAAGRAASAARDGRGERTVLGDLDLRTPEGRQVSLIPLVGSKAIVVVFWTSECARCAEEVSRLNELNSERLIKVVAVNEGESAKRIGEFTRKHGVAYDVIVDPRGAVARAFDVPGVPSCVILSRSGLIVYRGSALPEELDYYVAQ